MMRCVLFFTLCLASSPLVSSTWGCGKNPPAAQSAASTVRAPEESTMTTITTIQMSSSAFAQGATIPQMHTCDGKDASPPLAWGLGPEGTRTWALLVEDPDAPAKTWVHWVLFNLPASVNALSPGLPGSGDLENGARQGRNDFGKLGYGGPCPPPGGPHRYYFRLYALDAALQLAPGATRDAVSQAMEGHILGRGELMGTYARKR
jgi:Raf kinase inhibitor-like YbhB/YbcL family protein